MNRFNHLNVPETWQHYWSKYPEGYTILEALLNWVKQVDSMVDNQNQLNVTVTNFGNRLDEFIKQFDDDLQAEVIKTLSEWQESGLLDIIIDEALQTEIDNVEVSISQLSINVKTEGATGDGVADDTTAVKQALTKLATTGGELYFPPGTYLLNSRLDVPSNVTLRGSGRRASTIVKDVTHIHSDMVLIRDTAEHVRVLDLGFDGRREDGNTVTTKGVNIQGNHITVKGCLFKNIKTFDGVYVGTSIKSKHVTITHNEFEDIDRHGVGVIHSEDVTITHNRFKNCGLYAIDLEPNDPNTQTNDRFTVAFNHIDDTAVHGIVATVKARYGVIFGNTLRNINGEGIIVAYDSKHVVVESNTIDTTADNGVSVRLGASHVSVKTNTIKNAGRYGVRVGVSGADTSKAVDIVGNTIIDANRGDGAYDYIRLESLATGCLVEGNTCFSELKTKLPTYGINAISSKNRITANQFDDYTANNAIYMASNDNVQMGNYEKGIVKKPIHTSIFRVDDLGLLNQENYTEPTLQNGWINYGGTLKSVSFYKDKNKNVHLSGSIKNGTSTNGTVLFTLPTGYRPLTDITYLAGANSSGTFYPYKLTVKSNGDVTVSFLQTTTEVSVSIPPFRADQ